MPFDVDIISLVMGLSTLGLVFGIALNVGMYFIGSMFGVVTKIAS